MTLYRLTLEEISEAIVEIEATSEEEAIKMVMDDLDGTVTEVNKMMESLIDVREID